MDDLFVQGFGAPVVRPSPGLCRRWMSCGGGCGDRKLRAGRFTDPFERSRLRRGAGRGLLLAHAGGVSAVARGARRMASARGLLGVFGVLGGERKKEGEKSASTNLSALWAGLRPSLLPLGSFLALRASAFLRLLSLWSPPAARGSAGRERRGTERNSGTAGREKEGAKGRAKQTRHRLVICVLL